MSNDIADAICDRLEAAPASYAALHRELCALSRLAGPEPSSGIYPGRFGGLYSLRGCPFSDSMKEEVRKYQPPEERIEAYWNTNGILPGAAHHRVAAAFYWSVIPDLDKDVIEVSYFVLSGSATISVRGGEYHVRSNRESLRAFFRNMLHSCAYSNTEQYIIADCLPPKWDGVSDYATYLKYACKHQRVGRCPITYAMTVLGEQECIEFLQLANDYRHTCKVLRFQDLGPYAYC